MCLSAKPGYFAPTELQIVWNPGSMNIWSLGTEKLDRQECLSYFMPASLAPSLLAPLQ